MTGLFKQRMHRRELISYRWRKPVRYERHSGPKEQRSRSLGPVRALKKARANGRPFGMASSMEVKFFRVHRLGNRYRSRGSNFASQSLVGFSYAFFFKGFTGLAVTIGSIITLFIVMQIDRPGSTGASGLRLGRSQSGQASEEVSKEVKVRHCAARSRRIHCSSLESM